jgi:hypothetical protein
MNTRQDSAALLLLRDICDETACTPTQEPRQGLFASTFQVTWCRYLALMKGGPYSTDTQCAVTLAPGPLSEIHMQRKGSITLETLNVENQG